MGQVHEHRLSDKCDITENGGAVFENLARLSRSRLSLPLLSQWRVALGPIVAWTERLGFAVVESYRSREKKVYFKVTKIHLLGCFYHFSMNSYKVV